MKSTLLQTSDIRKFGYFDLLGCQDECFLFDQVQYAVKIWFGGNQRVLESCQKIKADVYVNASEAKLYVDISLQNNQNIKVESFEYQLLKNMNNSLVTNFSLSTLSLTTSRTDFN